MTFHNRAVHDVVITGAGPVGLFLACELALVGCSVLILERQADSSSLLEQLPFGICVLSAPTIEALYRRGLLQGLEVHKRLQNPHRTSAPLQTLADEYGGRISYVSGRVEKRFGLSAALIRPDGVVAWASERNPDGNELQAAAARWIRKEPI